MRTFWWSWIVLAPAVACGSRSADPAAPAATDTDPATGGTSAGPGARPDDAALPVVFGVSLGADVATLLVACRSLDPALDPASTTSATATCAATIDGIALELEITVEGGRVATLSFDLAGDDLRGAAPPGAGGATPTP